jgi:hypothetical protein
VRHLLLVSAAETVIGRGCELGGLSLRAAARLRPPGSAPGVFGHRASGPWQVLAGMWCITMFTRDSRPLRVIGCSHRGDRDPVGGMPTGSRVGRFVVGVLDRSGSPPPAGHTGGS